MEFSFMIMKIAVIRDSFTPESVWRTWWIFHEDISASFPIFTSRVCMLSRSTWPAWWRSGEREIFSTKLHNSVQMDPAWHEVRTFHPKCDYTSHLTTLCYMIYELWRRERASLSRSSKSELTTMSPRRRISSPIRFSVLNLPACFSAVSSAEHESKFIAFFTSSCSPQARALLMSFLTFKFKNNFTRSEWEHSPS